MAINSNPSLKARHMLFSATTGGGKTTAVHQLPQLKKARRIALYDPYDAYTQLGKKTVIKTYSLKHFAFALDIAMKQKKAFVVSLCRTYGVKELTLFARIVWALADGNKELHVVIEELIGSIVSPQTLSKPVAELWNGGRQFGLVMYALFQRPQEVPKTVVRQSQFKWIGKQDAKADCRYWSAEIDVPMEDIDRLQDLEYYLKEKGAPPQYGKIALPY
ncbi:hypothetical protein SAMN02745132_04890 [Enterovibrio nigricans DSM 22720]|uniref:Uncharacterized protein n=2 Tax=Enterovibrio nigricans TaxID=504469 RepID=A0A1T4WDY2_9GAMM|nr:hypothetical protein SAMN02745132_04890 [Enterovibrio nigricans DSM 22720]